MTSILYTTDTLAGAYAFLRSVRPHLDGLDYVLTVRREHDGGYSVILS